MKTVCLACLSASFAIGLFASPAYAQSFTDEFSDMAFDDGDPVEWFAFRTENGTVTVANDVANFKSTNGSSTSFGIALDLMHADVVSEMTAQFVNGDADTFLFNNLRDFRNSEVHQGQYWAVLSQAGELGIGFSGRNGGGTTAIRGEYLPTGPLGPQDIVKIRTEVSGSTIVHSAWLDGNDPSSGASITWTDRLDQYPIGELVAISLIANGNADAEVNIDSYSVTLVPEPTSIFLLMSCLFGASLTYRRRRRRRS